MNRTSIIIVGAGAAGLSAARVLSDAGRRVIILEGRDRIGGRIFTVRDRALNMPVELGAEFIHGKPAATWDLVRAAEQVAYDLPFEHLQKIGGQFAPHSQYMDDLKKAMIRLNRLRTRDMSFSDYLAKYRPGKSLARARQTALDFVEGFDAADPERISAQSLAEEREGLGDLEHAPQFRLLNGYGSLMECLHHGLKRPRVQVLFKKVIKEIHWNHHKADLLCVGHRQNYQAHRLLVTLPVGVLQLPPEAPGAVRFFPDIPQKRHHANRLGSGAVVKVILRFHNVFWEHSRAADAVFLHDPRAPFPTWWTARPLRLPLLTGWLGGPKALQMSEQPPQAIKTMALQSLHSLFGITPHKLDRMLAAFYCHNWPADPLARGAYSYATVHGKTAHQQLSEPIDGTLFFAGEATDTSGEASTVAGAIASGQRAAREILASL